MRWLALLAVLLATAAPAAAQQRAELSDIEDEVMCVSCNVPLFIAESPQADAQRQEIRAYIGQGLTKDEIKDRLVADYGEDVLAMPEDDGVGLAAKLTPIAAIVALLGGLVFVLTHWRRRPPAAASPAEPPPREASDAELRRLDEDLSRFG